MDYLARELQILMLKYSSGVRIHYGRLDQPRPGKVSGPWEKKEYSALPRMVWGSKALCSFFGVLLFLIYLAKE
ncbi:Hypothetical protein LUCI_4087 [Lucifera butyrica]|uniref:Uncharacterized protein n=1 Tax=Lucifera butyrica TaxID=1351585 RepID=A0A498RFB5_9FIRM|nr:hypothetical protein [Lucifera butyrica]VBB08783.1 Hypothetical protein LUCI_4064 [Lucifera butyrica]VBB08806.1 Hypothetical protein LUCI_4087 [Lucifera butyrica]